jgi:hypothetical protein
LCRASDTAGSKNAFHLVGVDLDEGIGPAVHDELVVLVEIGVLPDMVGAAVVDQVFELLLLLLLARCLKPAPQRFHEGSQTAKAIHYALNHWEGLGRFLEDGRIEIDTNTVERSIRPIALNR